MFDNLYKKYSSTKKLSVSTQSCGLMADHQMPMLTIEDKSQPGEIVCQVFSFVDALGGVNNMNVEGKSIPLKKHFSQIICEFIYLISVPLL